MVQIENKTKENDTEKILALTLKLPLFVLQFEQNKFMLRSINKSASKHIIRGGFIMKRDVVIASAVRTPIGSYGGSLSKLSAVDLGVIAAKEALKKAKVKPEMIEETIIGNVLGAGLGQNVSRQVSIGAGVPAEVPAFTINKVCGSGLRAVSIAYQFIQNGDNDIILCGGTESMSNAPYLLPNNRWGKRMGDDKVIDYMVHDGLFDIFNKYHICLLYTSPSPRD